MVNLNKNSAIFPIPDGWTDGLLSEFIEESSERNKKRLDIPVYSVTNVGKVVQQVEQFARIIHSKDTINYKIIRPGQFGYNPSRINVGSIALNSNFKAGLLSPMYVVFSTKKELDPLYLKHYTETYDFWRNVINGTAGTVRESLKFSAFEAFSFRFPKSTLEQSKIAGVLSTVDRAIEQTEALIAKQQRIKTGLMQDLLTRGIDEQGNLRSEETHQFKDSPLGRIPKEWICSPLSYFVPSAEYGISSSLSEIGYPVLRMNNFFDGEANISDLKYTDSVFSEKLLLRDKDILFNRTNSWEHVGRTGIWRNQIKKATFASYLVRLNMNTDLLIPELLNIWLNWRKSQISMRRYATPGVQQVNINPTNLRAILAAFPVNLDEQVKIVERYNSLRKVIISYSKELDKLRSLKTALMQDLLTGKVRVTPLLEKTEAIS